MSRQRTNSARALAARAIADIRFRGRALDQALADHSADIEHQHALIANLTYGAIRHYRELEHLLAALLNKPLPKKERSVHALLLAGLYERWHMATPAHAAVSETVAALKSLARPHLRGLVNAVLRRFDRERDSLLCALRESGPAVTSSHPDWLLDRLRDDYPDQWPAILEANQSRAPMWLRVNVNAIEPQQYLGRLSEAGIEAVQPLPAHAQALQLLQPVAVERLPGFTDGQVSVQDLAPQLVAPRLMVEPGMRVLDACAAPGGKTGHLLELAGGRIDLTALDIDPQRLSRVDETVRRLGFEARTVAADAAQPDDWWDGEVFDRILVDAPCTATGVIRRHPDIKILRRATDLAALAQRQVQMLEACWSMLRPGGCLVYATCSVLKIENNDAIAEFCRKNGPSARVDELRVDNITGVMTDEAGGLQLLPGTHDADGFYLARLWRSA